MDTVSIVIITKNEAHNIADCIRSARKVSSDIIVVDSGSTDDTVALATQAGAKVILIQWAGFGAARNIGATHALHPWMLAIDADERISDAMVSVVASCQMADDHIIYGFKRQSYFLGRKIRFGSWGRDSVYRLYNRNTTSWDLSAVHEQLTGTAFRMLKGVIDHYTVTSEAENTEKTNRYAALSADKYYAQGKRATFIKRFLSPAFEFIKSYFFLLGFLDGRPGYIIARSSAHYIALKYRLLHQLYKTSDSRK